MNEAIVSTPPMSRNIFEEYFRLIDKIIADIHDYSVNPHWVKSTTDYLHFLHRLTTATERVLQDISSEPQGRRSPRSATDLITDASKPPLRLTELSLEFMASWLLVLASWEENVAVLHTIGKVIFTVNNLLENRDSYTMLELRKYIAKLESGIDKVDLFESSNQEKLKYHINLQIDKMRRSTISERMLLIMIRDAKRKAINAIDYGTLDALNLNKQVRTTVNHRVYRAWMDKEVAALLPDPELDLDLQSIEEIQHMRTIIKAYDLSSNMQNLFICDDSVKNIIWDISVTISNDKHYYNAADAGFLLWTFSQGLSAIDGISVELVEWGEGSKRFQLRAKIQSMAAKVDLMQVLRKSRQSVNPGGRKNPSANRKSLMQKPIN